MKWRPMIAFAGVLLLFVLCPIPAYAAEVENQLWDAVDTETLEDAAEGSGDFSLDDSLNLEAGLGTLAEQALEQMEGALHGAIRSGGLMLLIVLFCGMGESLFQSGQTAMTRTADMIGIAAITLVAVSDTASMIGLGKEAIGQIEVFSKALIPTMSAASAACGSITGSVVRQASTLLFSDVLITLINRVLIPVIYLYIAVTALSLIHISEPTRRS